MKEFSQVNEATWSTNLVFLELWLYIFCICLYFLTSLEEEEEEEKEVSFWSAIACLVFNSNSIIISSEERQNEREVVPT